MSSSLTLCRGCRGLCTIGTLFGRPLIYTCHDVAKRRFNCLLRIRLHFVLPEEPSPTVLTLMGSESPIHLGCIAFLGSVEDSGDLGCFALKFGIPLR